MADTHENNCRDCGKPLEGGLYGGGETRVLGSPYCEPCVRARTLYCHTCRSPLKREDFESGKAVTLLGRRFCEDCLESAVREGRERAASDPHHRAVKSGGSKPSAEDQDSEALAIRRLYGRFLPHPEASLRVKGGGLLGALLGNRVKLWLDVSEGGFRAIISGRYELEDRLDGSIFYGPKAKSYPFSATVKHVRPSKRYSGCVLIGARFDAPSRELQHLISSKMSGQPVMIPAPPPKPSRRPASTKFPPASAPV